MKNIVIDEDLAVYKRFSGKALSKTPDFIPAGTPITIGHKETLCFHHQNVEAYPVKNFSSELYVLASDLDPVSRQFREDEVETRA